MTNWFNAALDEFLFDVAVDAKVTKEIVEKIYQVLNRYSVIDYDIMKEFLQDNYVEDENSEDD